MPVSADDTLTKFFAIFAGGGSPDQKTADLVALFCADTGNPTAAPAVGITHHGPNFVGVAQVTLLWRQFFTAFQDFMFSPAKLTLPGYPDDVPAPRLYSKHDFPRADAPIPIIGVQCFLSGDHVGPWFQGDHASLPLSGIRPARAAHNGPLHTQLPAAAVFAFDPRSGLITHLWVYLDRYKMMHDLAPGVAALLAGFHKALEEHKAAVSA